MSQHLQREIEGLKKKLLELSALVEENVMRAVLSVEKKDVSTAQSVLTKDEFVDKVEIEVEEECLKILALHQPVAVDLRFIVAAFKINNDLERIGDLAVNIAERSLALAFKPDFDSIVNFRTMCKKSARMLKLCLDSFVALDAKQAVEVCAADDEVDSLYREMYGKVKAGIAQNPGKIDEYLQILSISRHLERIADHATNIAEDVIYMVKGDIVRHQAVQLVHPLDDD